MMITKFTEEQDTAFGTRIYNVEVVPVDVGTLKSSRMGIRRMIDRLSCRIEKEVDKERISSMKLDVQKLRIIRRDLKKLEKVNG